LKVGRFTTEDLEVRRTAGDDESTYPVYGQRSGKVTVTGTWRSRPRGSRLFTDEQIRAIRADQRTLRAIATDFDCSHILVRNIRKGAAYEDVI